jgi:hypothetical protein
VDIVDPGRTGLWFAPDNPQDLSRKLRQLLSPALAMAKPRDIRLSVEARRASHVAGLYQNLYRQLISRDADTHAPTHSRTPASAP